MTTYTTIHNMSQTNKHNLCAATVYDQLCQDSVEKGFVSVKQYVAHLRHQVTGLSKEFMTLDRQLATGVYQMRQEREAKMARLDAIQADTDRITFVLSRYSEHYERMRTQKAAGCEPPPKHPPLLRPIPQRVLAPILFDNWEDAADDILQH